MNSLLFIFKFLIELELSNLDGDSISDKIDNEIFEAAKTYVIEINKSFNSEGYTCVSLQELVDYGYLKNINNPDKMIKIIRNTSTKVIQEIKYVNECN